jgi:hypothetical protein
VSGRKAITIGKKEQEQARTQPGNLGGSATGSMPLLRQNAVELLSGCCCDETSSWATLRFF